MPQTSMLQTRKPSTLRNLSALAASLLVAGALTGCAFSTATGTNGKGTNGLSSVHVLGNVYGGQQPVVGSTVKLYAAVTNGYGQTSTSILNSPGYVLTDANGSFGITDDYTCPTNTDGSSALVYLVATGGNPGSGSNNPSLAMMTALGSCATLKANAATTFVTINEVTTVASAFALSGFMSSITQVSTANTAAGIQGLTNAFATTNRLVSTATGTAMLTSQQVPTSTQGLVTAPQTKINTLADAIAACVNSAGNPTTGSCGTIFTAATVGGVAPTDTIQALLNIAHTPGQNASSIFSVVQPSAPFAPQMASAPNDWTMPLIYTGGGISAPQAVAIDGFGAAWIANRSNTVTQIAAPTEANTPATGYNFYQNNGLTAGGLLDAPSAIAISASNLVYVSSCGNSCSASGAAANVTQINPSTGTISSNVVTGNGLTSSYATAVDKTGNVWVANTFANSVAEFSASRTPLSGASGFSAGGLSYPIAVATDTSGNLWAANPAGGSVTKLSTAGASLAGTSGYTGGGLSYPYAVAIDHSGNAWIANHGANTLTVLNASGVAQSGTSGYTGAGITTPNAIALDGAGNAWVTNSNNSISVVSSTGAAVSNSTGYLAGLVHPNGVAVDGSGNVWVTSCGSVCVASSSDPGSVVEFVGAGVPVVTPMAAGAANNTLATRP